MTPELERRALAALAKKRGTSVNRILDSVAWDLGYAPPPRAGAVCITCDRWEPVRPRLGAAKMVREWCANCGSHKSNHGLPDGVHDQRLVIIMPVDPTDEDFSRCTWLLENL